MMEIWETPRGCPRAAPGPPRVPLGSARTKGTFWGHFGTSPPGLLAILSKTYSSFGLVVFWGVKKNGRKIVEIVGGT